VQLERGWGSERHYNLIIMTLQPFDGSWPLFQFLASIHSR
jgi:hypothetical protein